MNLQLDGVECTIRESRGDAPSARRYFFEDTEADPDADGRRFTLTCALDVTFLRVRAFTAISVLVLFFTGNPLEPQFVVAEMRIDDAASSHTKDHGDNWINAMQDFDLRAPGDLTAEPPGRTTADG